MAEKISLRYTHVASSVYIYIYLVLYCSIPAALEIIAR